MKWRTCDACSRTILLHWLTVSRAYCELPRRSRNRSKTFTLAEVLYVHRILGHTVSEKMTRLERKELAS